MKRTYLISIILAFAAIILLGSIVTGRKAAERSEESVQLDNAPKISQPGLTEERIDRILDRLKKNEPEKVQELTKLRAEDHEKFKQELAETIHANLTKTLESYRESRLKPEPKKGISKSLLVQSSSDRGIEGENRVYDKPLISSEKRYPEQDESLSQAKERRYYIHVGQARPSSQQYKELLEATKNNPRLTKVLREGFRLDGKHDIGPFRKSDLKNIESEPNNTAENQKK